MTFVQNICRFFLEFVRQPIQMGAVAPSSKSLARKMVDWVDLATARVVVEYGPGTGVFTGFILPKIPKDCKFFVIEYNSSMAEIFRQRYPAVALYEDSAQNVQALCQREDISTVDCIICGLPWASFSDDIQTELLEAMMTVLRPGGQFVTFAYLQGLLLPAAQRFRRRLDTYFSEVSTSSIVWLNLPPAFTYQCRR
jgi:phospholipid N-methyltransferase